MSTVLIVCGGREYTDEAHMFKVLDDALAYYGELIIVHGNYKGADLLADKWARLRHMHVVPVSAMWSHHGRPAGPKRNAAMLCLAPAAVLAFPGASGTADMVYKARMANVPVYIV